MGGHWVSGGTLGGWGDTGGQISFGTLGPAEQQYKDRHSGQKRQETGRTAGRKHWYQDDKDEDDIEHNDVMTLTKKQFLFLENNQFYTN